jgi:hypothetical protein
MKKLLFLFPVFLFACCELSKEPNIKADKGFFIVQGIESVENDSSKVLCKYKIISDTLSSSQSIANENSVQNPFIFFLTDTSGKYKIGDTLFLGLKPIIITE